MTQFMRARNLTADALAKMLGYRSKAMLTRIIKGNVNLRGMEAFSEKLRETIELTDEEQSALQNCVNALRWQDDYASVQEMLDLVRGTSESVKPMMLETVDGTKRMTILERYSDADDIRITLLNSQYAHIFEDLYELIVRRDAHIEHFLLENANTARTVHAVNVLLKIVYEPNYSGYTRSSKNDPHRGIEDSDMMAVSYCSASGERREDVIVFDTVDHGVVCSSAGQNGYHVLLSIPKDQYMPVKRTYMDKAAVDDYITYSNTCMRLEYNRPVYKIKPDFCLDFISSDILLSAVTECPAFGEESVGDLMNEMVKIYQKRFQNTFEKRKPTHCICRRDAMWKFVETGRLSDHFWAMRPFTPAERVRILQTILDQMKINPYFHLHFMKQDDFLRNMEIICFEDQGILILDANTDYNLESGHSEILVAHPEILRLYRDFFMQNLVQEQTISAEETCEILQQMIDACEKMQ